jgi:hypothetical protein
MTILKTLNKKIIMIKSYYLKIVVVAITLFTLSGCAKFLEEEIKNNASPSNFYSNLSECKAAVNGTYVVLYDMFSSTDFFVTAEASTDLMVMKTANNLNGTFGYSPSAPGTGQELWKNAYKGIMYANNTITGIENAPISADEKKALIAEVIALRSLYYYFLTSVFSDVPYWDKGLLTEDQVNEVISLPRTNANEIRTQLIADLELYAPSLLSKASGNDIGRVTQGFAYGLMAKIALFNKDWAKAKWATEQVINSGVYELAPNYGDIYTDANNKENIFEVQYSYSPTGLQRSHSIYNWCMPSPRSGSTSVYDGVDMESSSATTYGSVQPTRRLASYYTTTDKRRAHVLAYDYKGKQFNRAKNQNLPWMGPKMWDFTSINIASGKNLLYMRYADILLMMAEASIELNELEDAKFYMDLVRNRAGIGSIAVTNQTIMTEELRKERGRELSGEYVRKWDLVRWGIFYESIKSVALDYPTAAQNVKPYHLYYPIPALERVKNPALSQNNGY